MSEEIGSEEHHEENHGIFWKKNIFMRCESASYIQPKGR